MLPIFILNRNDEIECDENISVGLTDTTLNDGEYEILLGYVWDVAWGDYRENNSNGALILIRKCALN